MRSALKTTDAIFIGKVTSVVDTVSPGWSGQRAIFVLETVWKGPTGQTATVLSSSGDWWLRFHVGEHYLVFATARTNGVLFQRGCSYTRPLAAAKQYLPALGEPRVRLAPPASALPPR